MRHARFGRWLEDVVWQLVDMAGWAALGGAVAAVALGLALAAV